MIIYLITGLGMGGAERQVVELAIQAQKSGDTPYIIALNSEEEPNAWHDILQMHHIPFKHLNLKKNIFSFLSSIFAFHQMLRALFLKTNFNFKNNNLINQGIAIHSHMFHANLFARIWRLFEKMHILKKISHQPIQLICTAHSQNEGGALRMWAYRLTHNLNDIFTHVSEDARQSFIRQKIVKPYQILTICNGVDFQAIEKNKKKSTTSAIKSTSQNTLFKKWLTIGRLAPEKNQSQLILAFAELIKHKEHTHDSFFIIGDGPEYENLKKLVDDLQLNQSIYFLKTRYNVIDYIYDCDALIFSSYYEGFGLAMAEAIIAGKPLLSTACGGISQYFPADILVQVDDALGLAHKMKNLDAIYQSNPLLQNNLKQALEGYDIRLIYKEWRALYFAHSLNNIK